MIDSDFHTVILLANYLTKEEEGKEPHKFDLWEDDLGGARISAKGVGGFVLDT